MSIGRKLGLLATLAMAALSMAASTASAQEEQIEVVREATGAHCTTASPCQVTATGSSSITTHVFGFETVAFSCTDQFTANIRENGTGSIPTISLTGANCLRVPCNGVGEPTAERNWQILAAGETGPNVGHMNLRFCLDDRNNPDGTGTHCTIELAVDEPVTHRYRFRALDSTCSAGVEFNSSWTATTGAIEIRHL